MKTNLEHRVLGLLIGGALGDALAAPFENQAAPKFEVPNLLRVTDDTQMTIATCEGILQAGRVDPEAIAGRFVKWYRERRFSGVGASTLKALVELEAGGHWAMSGASGERAAGNGAAMRVAPLALFLDPNNTQNKQVIRDVCRITHRNDEAYLGGLSIVFAIRCKDLDRSLLGRLAGFLPDSQIRDRLIQIDEQRWGFSELVKRKPPTGFVVDSVPAAILAAIECESFLETIAKIVEAGGDTDTTAAMFGSLFGWHKETEMLPLDLAARIEECPQIESMARGLAAVRDGWRDVN